MNENLVIKRNKSLFDFEIIYCYDKNSYSKRLHTP